MDSLSIVGLSVFGFVTVLLMLFWIGFRRPVPEYTPEPSPELQKMTAIPEQLPEPLVKHFYSLYGSEKIPVYDTAVVWGVAKYKISGLWMPLRFITYFRAGSSFLRKMDFFWYGKIILKGIDFFIDGIGAVHVNGVMHMKESGVQVTESQQISFWAESLLTGTMDFSDHRLQWETADTHHISVTVPEVTDPIHVFFNRKTGRIESIRTKRFRGQLEKKKIQWNIRVSKWNKLQTVWMPDYSIAWEDQKKAWCHYKVLGIAGNASIDEEMKTMDPGLYKDRGIKKKKEQKRTRHK